MYCHCNGCLDPSLVQFMCSVFVALWRGSVKYHGPWPSRWAKQVPSWFIRVLSWPLSAVLQYVTCSKQQGTGNGPLLAIPRSNRVPHQLCTEFCAGFHCKYTDDCFCHTWENGCFCSDNMHKHPGWVGKFLSAFQYLGNPLSWSPDSPQVLLFEPRESGIFVIEPAVRVSKLELRLMGLGWWDRLSSLKLFLKAWVVSCWTEQSLKVIF
jgi:hypothetical protein